MELAELAPGEVDGSSLHVNVFHWRIRTTPDRWPVKARTARQRCSMKGRGAANRRPTSLGCPEGRLRPGRAWSGAAGLEAISPRLNRYLKNPDTMA
jgi:hypothetical protein